MFTLYTNTILKPLLTNRIPHTPPSVTNQPRLQTMEGTCLCGAITVAVTDPDLYTRRRGHLCHCANCRKTSGSTYGANLAIESEKVKITGEDKLKEYRDSNTLSGNTVSRFFCSNCGKWVWCLPSVTELNHVRPVWIGMWLSYLGTAGWESKLPGKWSPGVDWMQRCESADEALIDWLTMRIVPSNRSPPAVLAWPFSNVASFHACRSRNWRPLRGSGWSGWKRSRGRSRIRACRSSRRKFDGVMASEGMRGEVAKGRALYMMRAWQHPIRSQGTDIYIIGQRRSGQGRVDGEFYIWYMTWHELHTEFQAPYLTLSS